MDNPARLIITLGSQPEHEYPLTLDITIIGREALNDLVINDPEVSRRHSRIKLENGRYMVEDLGSTNGTFVNGQRVTSPRPLDHGDAIELGKSVRIVFLGSALSPVEEQPEDRAAFPALPDAPVGDDDEAYFARPDSPPVIVDDQPQYGMQRYLIGCGCVALLLIFVAGVALYIIDQTACDLLYCGTLKPFWEALVAIFGRSLACPCG